MLIPVFIIKLNSLIFFAPTRFFPLQKTLPFLEQENANILSVNFQSSFGSPTYPRRVPFPDIERCLPFLPPPSWDEKLDCCCHQQSVKLSMKRCWEGVGGWGRFLLSYSSLSYYLVQLASSERSHHRVGNTSHTRVSKHGGKCERKHLGANAK